MRVALFFPPAAPLTGAPMLRGWWLEAGETEPAPERRPLVLLSHGHGGSRFGHHDLAEALARAGFIVAAPEHIGDTVADLSGVGTERVLYGRAWQLRATLDGLLADATFGSRIDVERVGVAGFSAGGYTSLLFVGAEPDFTRINGYCARHPGDSELCGVKRDGPLAPAAKPTKDARAKAAFVMAPLGVFFGPSAFDAVTAPVHLTFSTADEVLLPAENAAPVRDGLKTLEGVDEVANAGHSVFIAPCPASLAAEAPAICNDPRGVDRAAVHAKVSAAAVSFFIKTLGAP